MDIIDKLVFFIKNICDWRDREAKGTWEFELPRKLNFRNRRNIFIAVDLMMKVEDYDESSDSFFENSLEPLLMLSFKSKKSVSSESSSVEEKISKISFSLVSSVSIISPIRLKGTQFKEELITHRFERRTKNLFGAEKDQLLREQLTMLSTFTSLLKGFKKSIQNQFYLLLNASLGVMYFSYQAYDGVLEPILIISSGKESFAQELIVEDIPFEFLAVDGFQREKLLLRNKQIVLFYGYLVNMIIRSDASFEIIANFPYDNSQIVCPYEIYNGPEHREIYQDLAERKQTILGESYYELFHLKIEGIWFYDNIRLLNKKLQETCKFDISYEIMGTTNSLHKDCLVLPTRNK